MIRIVLIWPLGRLGGANTLSGLRERFWLRFMPIFGLGLTYAGTEHLPAKRIERTEVRCAVPRVTFPTHTLSAMSFDSEASGVAFKLLCAAICCADCVFHRRTFSVRLAYVVSGASRSLH